MKKSMLRFSVCLLAFLFLPLVSNSQKTRDEISDRFKWDLSTLYKSNEDWNSAREILNSRIPEFEKFKGILTRSSTDLLKYLNLSTEVEAEANKLYLYASLNSDLDKRNMVYSGMKQQLELMFADLSTMTAFDYPEILKADWSLIDNYIRSEPGFVQYRVYLEDLFRKKEHKLSEPEERIMSLAALNTSTPNSIYSIFSNAEMPVPEAILSTGVKVKITKSQYSLYRELPVRADRKIVFDAYWNNWENYKATFGEMLSGKVKSDLFNAKARHYNSTLEASLDNYNIPISVYTSLIDNVTCGLPAFHRYLAIKKKMLGVDTLKSYDLYAPVVKNVELKYSFEEGSKIVLEALKPLGEEYVNTVRKALNNRWIDVYPTTGKRSGGYSTVFIRDLHPFILLNYNGSYRDVSTLAHEIGHTMHSYLSSTSQPAPVSNYSIFVAEVASTFNEVLFIDYLIKNLKDDETRLSLLMEWLEVFRAALFRQTQFAEFELKVHEAAWKGLPLTGETISAMYLDILRKYYVGEKGVCSIDKSMEIEWAFVPHFYNSFYVYQYGTAFTASISLAEKVLSGDKDALKKYITFLSSGKTDYPIALLKKAGTDMTTKEPFENSIEAMNKIMDEVEKILEKK